MDPLYEGDARTTLAQRSTLAAAPPVAPDPPRAIAPTDADPPSHGIPPQESYQKVATVRAHAAPLEDVADLAVEASGNEDHPACLDLAPPMEGRDPNAHLGDVVVIVRDTEQGCSTIVHGRRVLTEAIRSGRLKSGGPGPRAVVLEGTTWGAFVAGLFTKLYRFAWTARWASDDPELEVLRTEVHNAIRQGVAHDDCPMWPGGTQAGLTATLKRMAGHVPDKLAIPTCQPTQSRWMRAVQGEAPEVTRTRFDELLQGQLPSVPDPSDIPHGRELADDDLDALAREALRQHPGDATAMARAFRKATQAATDPKPWITLRCPLCGIVDVYWPVSEGQKGGVYVPRELRHALTRQGGASMSHTPRHGATRPCNPSSDSVMGNPPTEEECQ